MFNQRDKYHVDYESPKGQSDGLIPTDVMTKRNRAIIPAHS